LWPAVILSLRGRFFIRLVQNTLYALKKIIKLVMMPLLFSLRSSIRHCLAQIKQFVKLLILLKAIWKTMKTFP